ncbi:MAG: hypothetical protein ACRD3O_17700, partial [Terriglobia bacterium]
LSALGAFAIAIMVGLLAWAAWDAVSAWNGIGDVEISPLGWVFLGLSVVVTFLVGAGLMALIFCSSRHDMDH